ncbi:Arc family DNA-binding protein [Halomonas sp. McH1-25]|uniref:Arc family DNA-binding protein n=1 Tax=unclassified Halomonas TaxID=2609666 RepID=UPI001EF531CC|nr:MULTISPECIES: Arc family DNA-binding protein [unclassified Halomonas]MCG7598894.1 Arc family DNA-binding protein [Halomonas sp. McH1-25]MCP1340857.1 Arc family DNA-binding protein [Halomonas sp. FL8]MCP1361260.1 Arc family DNA-binding protein [Halomonas sp. BBD45]MCP1363760.1 Arc family DNA-binding protein [Halomonas sp. BBD48]
MTQYRTQVRFPSKELAQQVKQRAKEQQRSMNAQLIRLIELGMKYEQQSTNA